MENARADWPYRKAINKMKIPYILIGTENSVKHKTEGLAEYFLHERQLPNTLFSQMLDINELLDANRYARTLFEQRPLHALDVHFRPYCLTDSYFDNENYRVAESNSDTKLFFDTLVAHPWGLLVLLTFSAILPSLSKKSEYGRTLFSAIIQNWESFLQNRQFFTEPGQTLTQKSFWNYPLSTLFPLMIEAGVPKEAIKKGGRSTFSDEGIKALIEKHILTRPHDR